MITKCLLKWKLTCSGWWGSVWRVASHLCSPQVGGMKKKKIIIVIKSLGMDLFVKIIKMRYCSYSCKIAHHFKYLSIFRREVVTKQTEGYSQQQQEEEEEILVFQVQSIPCLSKNSKIAAKFNPHHYHGSGRSLSHCSWCCSHSSSQSRRIWVSSSSVHLYWNPLNLLHY